MVLKYHISTSAITEDFVVRIYEAESGAQVVPDITLVEKNGSGVPTPGAGHQVIETIIQSGLDSVVHIIRMYGAVSANLLHEYETEPLSESLVTIFAPIQFKIGDGGANTPAVDTDTCTTPELAGLTEDQFTIHRNNYGFLLPDIPANPIFHFTFNTGTGEWQLQGGDLFGADEEFTIQRHPQAVTTVINDSVVGKLFGGFVDVSANTSYDIAHLRKLIRFSGSPVYTFAALDEIPEGYIFAFQHFGSSGTPSISFLNGSLLWAGSPKTSIDIPRYSEGAFVWDGTNWNVVYLSESTWVNGAGSVAAGTTLGVGRYNVGDVPPGDPIYTITHNLAISGDYLVFWSIESNDVTTYFRNNKICGTWYHHATDKPNKFYISLQEVSAETQTLSIAWMAVKV